MNDDQDDDARPPDGFPAVRGPFGGIPYTPHLHQGATTNDLDSILRDGLRPLLADEEAKSEYPSPMGFIGLTRANGFFYAADQSNYHSTLSDDPNAPQPDPVIFEIDTTFLDLQRVYPGEIYLGWARDEFDEKGNQAPVPPPVSMYLPQARREWVRSLEHLGIISYKGLIPREAIVRYAVVDKSHCPNLFHVAEHFRWDGEVWPAMRVMVASLNDCLFEGTPLFDESWRYESYNSLISECLELMRDEKDGDRLAAAKLPLVTKKVEELAAIRARSAACLEERQDGVRVVNLRQ